MAALSATSRRPDDAASAATAHSKLPPRSSLKRKRNDMDLDSSQPTDSSPKRSVTFSDEVEAQDDPSAVIAIRKEVRFALESYAVGDPDAYDTLQKYFGSDEKKRLKPDTLRLYLMALTANIALLRRSYGGLVYKILESDWTGQDDEFVATYIRFLGGLVSSHGAWLNDVLGMLVDRFANDTASAASEAGPVDLDRVHAALQYILRLVPSASKVLGESTHGRLSLLANRFPHPTDTRRVHVRYVRSLLRLTGYAPELQSEVLALVTERVVKIDVQVQVDFEDLADEIGDDIISNLPPLEDDAFDEDEEDDDEDMDEEELDSHATRVKSIRANMSKLDAIMDMLFNYYATAFENAASAEAATASEILLSHFRKLILPTYKSRHTQFLLFHFMQTAPALVDAFLGACVQLVLDKRQPAMIRQSAATYLASFVSRGLHVPRALTGDVFAFLAEQLAELRGMYEPSCRGPNLRAYHTYYALAQALLYIFCFRWRDLAIDAEGDDDAASLSPPTLPGSLPGMMASVIDPDDPLAHIEFPRSVRDALTATVFSPLNPLRICAPAIAAEFVDTARKLRVLYAHHVLETNKRVRLLVGGAGSGGARGGNSGGTSTPTAAAAADAGPTNMSASRASDDLGGCLDGYFPFDPYQLPASRAWVDGDYRAWEPVDDGEEEEDSSDEEDDEDDDTDDEEEEDGMVDGLPAVRDGE